MTVQQAPSRTADTRLAMTAVFASSAALMGVGFLVGNPALRQIGIFGILFFGVGTAPLQLSAGPGVWTRLGIAGLFGFTVITGIGAVMVYISGAWHPLVVALEVLLIATAVHIAALVQMLTTGAAAGAVAQMRRIFSRVRVTPSLILTLIGTSLWLITAITTGHLDAVADGGILQQMSPIWFLGVFALVAAVAVADRERELDVALPIISMALAITLTPGLVYSAPRSQSAAKHAGLVIEILRTHHIIRQAGIYPAYSGFFAAIAWICDLARIRDPTFGLAAYWPMIVGLAAVVEYRWLFRRLTQSPYGAWIGTGVAVLVNSIGQDYFSPQSVGFVMALGALAVALPPVRPATKSTRVEYVLLILAGLAMAPEHELSPFIVGGILLLALVLTRARPWWGFLAFLLPAIAWAVLNHGVLGDNLSVADAFNLANFDPPTQPAAAGLVPTWNERFSSDGLVVSMLVLTLFGGAGFLRNIRQRWSWMYGCSATVGLLIVLVNPYGNEGIFRAALFAIPFLTMLGIRAVAGPTHPGASRVGGRRRRMPSVQRVLRSRITLALAGAGLTAVFLIASYGMDPSSVIQPASYAAIQYFERTTPEGAQLVLIPTGDEATEVIYGADSRGEIDWGAIERRAWLKPGHPTLADAAQMETLMRKQAPNVRPDEFYVLWTPVLAKFSQDYGLQSLAQSRRWPGLLERTGQWHPVFERDGVRLLHFVPGQKAQPKTHGIKRKATG